MAHIKITRGLDIPILGKPSGEILDLIPSGSSQREPPKKIALDLKPFEGIKFKILTKIGDNVKIGQPIAEDKDTPGRMFCSPAHGTISEIRRGDKRVLQEIVIDVVDREEFYEHESIDIGTASREQLIAKMLEGGIFSKIRSRPFNFLANPMKPPRNIFVKAIESAPFVPSAELQVAGHEKEFQVGLEALSKLTSGTVHLVHRVGSSAKAFTEAKGVQIHTAEGPHPIANPSLHIQQIDPVKGLEDVIWTLNVHDVISLGYLLSKGRYYVDRIISIAGPGVIQDRIGYFRAREGIPISSLISGRIDKERPLRSVSGDPLMGSQVNSEGFLGLEHFAFTVIPENTHREFLHFFRFGGGKYSFSRAYLSGHRDNSDRQYFFTTSQHGEHRAFIDSSLYDKVMPLPISTIHLVKAVMSENFELAEQLGLLSVVGEDFALPTFVCPSKMEMTSIMKSGLRQYAHEMLG